MAIEIKDKSISISVKDLVALENNFHGYSDVGAVGFNRAELGRLAHEKYQTREVLTRNFEKEVRIKHQLEVDGYAVTRLHMDEANRAYPPELNAEVEAVLARVEDYGDEDRTHNFSRIDHVFDTTHLLLDRDWLDFVALFEGVSDWVEHRYWKYYEPEHFDPEIWDYTLAAVEAGKDTAALTAAVNQVNALLEAEERSGYQVEQLIAELASPSESNDKIKDHR